MPSSESSDDDIRSDVFVTHDPFVQPEPGESRWSLSQLDRGLFPNSPAPYDPYGSLVPIPLNLPPDPSSSRVTHHHHHHHQPPPPPPSGQVQHVAAVAAVVAPEQIPVIPMGIPVLASAVQHNSPPPRQPLPVELEYTDDFDLDPQQFLEADIRQTAPPTPTPTPNANAGSEYSASNLMQRQQPQPPPQQQQEPPSSQVLAQLKEVEELRQHAHPSSVHSFSVNYREDPLYRAMVNETEDKTELAREEAMSIGLFGNTYDTTKRITRALNNAGFVVLPKFNNKNRKSSRGEYMRMAEAMREATYHMRMTADYAGVFSFTDIHPNFLHKADLKYMVLENDFHTAAGEVAHFLNTNIYREKFKNADASFFTDHKHDAFIEDAYNMRTRKYAENLISIDRGARSEREQEQQEKDPEPPENVVVSPSILMIFASADFLGMSAKDAKAKESTFSFVDTILVDPFAAFSNLEDLYVSYGMKNGEGDNQNLYNALYYLHSARCLNSFFSSRLCKGDDSGEVHASVYITSHGLVGPGISGLACKKLHSMPSFHSSVLVSDYMYSLVFKRMERRDKFFPLLASFPRTPRIFELPAAKKIRKAMKRDKPFDEVLEKDNESRRMLMMLKTLLAYDTSRATLSTYPKRADKIPAKKLKTSTAEYELFMRAYENAEYFRDIDKNIDLTPLSDRVRKLHEIIDKPSNPKFNGVLMKWRASSFSELRKSIKLTGDNLLGHLAVDAKIRDAVKRGMKACAAYLPWKKVGGFRNVIFNEDYAGEANAVIAAQKYDIPLLVTSQLSPESNSPISKLGPRIKTRIRDEMISWFDDILKVVTAVAKYMYMAREESTLVKRAYTIYSTMNKLFFELFVYGNRSEDGRSGNIDDSNRLLVAQCLSYSSMVLRDNLINLKHLSTEKYVFGAPCYNLEVKSVLQKSAAQDNDGAPLDDSEFSDKMSVTPMYPLSQDELWRYNMHEVFSRLGLIDKTQPHLVSFNHLLYESTLAESDEYELKSPTDVEVTEKLEDFSKSHRDESYNEHTYKLRESVSTLVRFMDSEMRASLRAYLDTGREFIEIRNAAEERGYAMLSVNDIETGYKAATNRALERAQTRRRAPPPPSPSSSSSPSSSAPASAAVASTSRSARSHTPVQQFSPSPPSSPSPSPSPALSSEIVVEATYPEPAASPPYVPFYGDEPPAEATVSRRVTDFSGLSPVPSYGMSPERSTTNDNNNNNNNTREQTPPMSPLSPLSDASPSGVLTNVATISNMFPLPDSPPHVTERPATQYIANSPGGEEEDDDDIDYHEDYDEDLIRLELKKERPGDEEDDDDENIDFVPGTPPRRRPLIRLPSAPPSLPPTLPVPVPVPVPQSRRPSHIPANADFVDLDDLPSPPPSNIAQHTRQKDTERQIDFENPDLIEMLKQENTPEYRKRKKRRMGACRKHVMAVRRGPLIGAGRNQKQHQEKSSTSHDRSISLLFAAKGRDSTTRYGLEIIENGISPYEVVLSKVKRASLRVISLHATAKLTVQLYYVHPKPEDDEALVSGSPNHRFLIFSRVLAPALAERTVRVSLEDGVSNELLGGNDIYECLEDAFVAQSHIKHLDNASLHARELAHRTKRAETLMREALSGWFEINVYSSGDYTFSGEIDLVLSVPF